MNWLRKAYAWVWLNKERAVLAIMVAILVFRVYQVLNPPEDEGAKDFQPPRRQLDDGDSRLPAVPPVVPQTPLTEDWSRLWRFSLFTYRQPRQTGSANAGDDVQQRNITLIQLREKPDGTKMARIRTETRTDWYDEGESFEQYSLQAIDLEKQCVSIFSEEDQRLLSVCIAPEA